MIVCLLFGGINKEYFFWGNCCVGFVFMWFVKVYILLNGVISYFSVDKGFLENGIWEFYCISISFLFSRGIFNYLKID